MEPATGTLVIYSPGYEDRPARMSGAEAVAWIPFTRAVLCLKAIGGPFDFNIEIMPINGSHRPSGTTAGTIQPGGAQPINRNPSQRDEEDEEMVPGSKAQSRELGR